MRCTGPRASVPGKEFGYPAIGPYIRRPRLPLSVRATREELVAYAIEQGADPAMLEGATREHLLEVYVRRAYSSPSPALASWLPVAKGLTPHGLRHSWQTAMDDGGIKRALSMHVMGHEDHSMPARYGHITDTMREELLDLQARLWSDALAWRARLDPRSTVGVLDAALAPWRDGSVTPLGSVSQNSPKRGQGRLTG